MSYGKIEIDKKFFNDFANYISATSDAVDKTIKDGSRHDGFVNVNGARAPRDRDPVDYHAGIDVQPGTWYNMPPKIEDHIYWCGHSGDIYSLYADFDRMLKLYDRLP